MPLELTCPLHGEVVDNIKEELASLKKSMAMIPELDKKIAIIDEKLNHFDKVHTDLNEFLKELDAKWTAYAIKQEEHEVKITQNKTDIEKSENRIKGVEEKTSYLMTKIATFSGGVAVVVWLIEKFM